MPLRRNRPAAGESFLKQFNLGHVQHGKLTPVRQTTAAAFSRGLICKEVHNAFLNAIILRLHDPFFIVVFKAQQASLMDGRQDELMNSRINVGRRWVPYYMK